MPLIATAARCFDAVARHGSIRRAAEHLHASPSAISRQILNLEAEYGTALFERMPHGVRLTAAGELLLTKIRAWQHDLAQARKQLQELQGLRRGHVTVGVMECLARDVAPTIFAQIRDRHPGITLAASVAGTDRLVRDVVAGQIDIAIAFNVPSDSRVRTTWSAPVQIGIVAAPGHPLALAKAVKLTDLVQYATALPDRSLAVRTLIDAALAREGAELSPVTTSNSVEIIKGAVKFGSQISLLSQIDVHREVERGELVFRPLSDREFRPEILSLCAHPRRTQSPIVSAALEEIRTALAAMFDGGASNGAEPQSAARQKVP
jgi:DNA-binding transcriptional LysR family regulator